MASGLKYNDEKDKCYGIAGMVVAMLVWDNENLLESVTLDTPDNENIIFSNDFYFTGNPRISPKYTWNKIVGHYKVMMEMLVANIMCRQCVLHDSHINSKLKNLMYHHLEEEGYENCSLEKDEIRQLFEQSYDSLHRIFSHRGVQQIVRDFAESLQQQRTFSQAEVLHRLQALSML